MAAKTVLKLLTDYFNVGEGKRPMKAWAEEVKALSMDEKAYLAALVCEATGDTTI